jgi:RNA polymerase sigma-70 factor (ECF subfamily)
MSKDIAQETFLKAFKKISHLRSETKLLPWLCSIAANLAKNALKNRTCQLVDYQQASGAVSNSIERVEIKIIITAVLDTLTPSYKIVIILYYYYGFSINEVAQMLKLSPKTISSRLSRGRKLIKEKLKQEYSIEGGTTFVRLY